MILMYWYIGISGQIGEGDKLKLDGMLIEEVWVSRRVPENLHGCCRC